MAPAKTVARASKTHQLYLLLRHQIASGELSAGDMLPSEFELGNIHGVSRVTIRRALGQLEEEGLIYRKVGAGAFVKDIELKRPISADLTDTLANLNELGRMTSVKLLSLAYEVPPKRIATSLKLPQGTRTQKSVRIRLMNDAPFSYLLTHVPEKIASTYSEQELASQSLLRLLDRSGVVIDRARQTISATLATPEIAEALKIDAGDALLSLTRVIYDKNGDGVQHLQVYYRPDRYRFEMDLVRGEATEQFYWAPDHLSAQSAPKREFS